MYLIKESAVISWKEYNELKFLNCACKFTEKASIDENASKRKEMKKLISELRSKNYDIDRNIFKALDNVNLNCVVGIKKDGVYKPFLDDYDKKC
jgi:ADP-heptose:LPS heptosyltransferase